MANRVRPRPEVLPITHREAFCKDGERTWRGKDIEADSDPPQGMLSLAVHPWEDTVGVQRHRPLLQFSHGTSTVYISEAWAAMIAPSGLYLGHGFNQHTSTCAIAKQPNMTFEEAPPSAHELLAGRTLRVMTTL